MKISFNDKSLHTTFEYPSESSLAQEAEAEAEAEGEEEEEEVDEGGSGLNGAVEKPFALFLPRATFVNSVAPESPRLPDGSSGECSPVQVGSPVGSLGYMSMCSHVHMYALACRPVQLHSKALHGLQQVAGADFGTGPQRGGALTEGGHGEWGRGGCPGTGWRQVSKAWESPLLTCLLPPQLTPASHNDLSDFRSEPALYF